MTRVAALAACGALLIGAACQPESERPPIPTTTTVEHLASYQFVSQLVGWLEISAGDNQVIAKTLDAGRTWRTQLKAAAFARTPVMQWIDAQHGVLVGQKGESGLILRSDDGGKSWRSHEVVGPVAHYPSQWIAATGYFVDSSHGWVLFRKETCGPSTWSCPAQFRLDFDAY